MNTELVVTFLAGLAAAVAALLITESGFLAVLVFFATCGFVVYAYIIGDEINRRLRRHYTRQDF